MSRFFNINRRFQAFYFIKFAAIGVFSPYMALYFTSRGMTGIQMGLILGMLPLVKMFVQPLFSLVGDIYHAHRAIMFLSCLATAVGICGLYLVDQFMPILMVMVVFSALDTPAEPAVNALALDYLEEQHRENDFGTLRMWGSIGFALSSFIAGGLLTGDMLMYQPLFFALLCVVLAFLCLTLPIGAPTRTLTWLEGIKILPQRPVLALFLVGVVMLSASLNITVQYMAIFLENINTASWLIGFIIAVQALIEVPLMGKTPRIIEKLGLKKTLMLGVFLMPLRWLAYLFIRNAWAIIPTQAFHSIGIVSLQVVALPFVDRLVPHEWRATGQGLLSTAFRGIGPGLGLLASGFIFEYSGIQGIWWICLAFSILGVLAIDASLKMPAAHRALADRVYTGQ